MTKILPWDYHPDLAADRLTFVGRLIAEGRNKAVERHDPENGDDNWTLGCSAFQFGRFRILNAVDSGAHDWLHVLDRSLQLVFQIGQLPARMYRGYADDPPGRTLYQTFSELRQLDLLAGQDDEARELTYRFAVETDFDGSTLAVKFVGLRGDSPVFVWDVPLDDIGASVGTVGRPATESVPLDPPDVSPRRSVSPSKKEN
ncbi:hypothetical protein [Devosia riboflavina]